MRGGPVSDRILPFATPGGMVNVELSDSVHSLSTEEICRQANLQLPGAILTPVGPSTIEIRNARTDTRPARPKSKRGMLTPPQRNLLIHMRDTGGWCYGDPIRTNPQVLDALERKGLIIVHTPENAPWMASAELTEAGRTFFETP